jgi:multidrug resistance protein MdtO
MSGSLRDMAAILIAVVLGMTLRVPGMSLALALLYLMQRERPGLTLNVGLQIFLGSVVACFGSLLWVQLTDGDEIARFLGLAVGIFVAAFCMVSTSIPLFWTIIGFYGFVDLSSWDAHRSSDAIVTSSLYNIAALGIVVLCAVGVEFFFGTRHPSSDLDHEFSKRLNALRNYFFLLANSNDPRNDSFITAQHQVLIQLAHAGDTYLNELYDRFRDSLPKSTEAPPGIHYRIGLLLQMLDAAVAYGVRLPQEHPESYRQAYRAIGEQCTAILADSNSPAVALSEETPWQLQDISRQLTEYANSLHQAPAKPKAIPGKPASERSGSLFSKLFLPGVFDSPDSLLYALKLTLAAMVCYIIYNAVAWPGILTCVVTVLFTGLTSTGAMKQKQLYRFSGAAIGGALAILTVSVFYPNMDSITSLVLVVAPLALLAGWVARSPHIGYVGIQIGFGYFLTALPGFSAATQIAPARDRVIGVALGILVMWFIFDQLWPIRTTDALRSSLEKIRAATSELKQLVQELNVERGDHAFQRLRTAVSLELANVYQLAFSAQFEVGRHRKRELARTRRLLKEVEESSGEFYSTAGRI